MGNSNNTAEKVLDQIPGKIKDNKKTYQPPSWEVEQVFEKTALGCLKVDDNACQSGPIQS